VGADFDVAIVGAGPAGAATAIAIAGTASVVLIDRDASPVSRIGESLPGAVRPILRQLDILEDVAAGGHRVCQGVLSCWGTEGLAVRDSFTEPNGAGWLLDRPAFETGLRHAAVKSGATIMFGSMIVSARRVPTGDHAWELKPKNGPSIRARFIVDATGRSARIARDVCGAVVEFQDRLVCRFARLPPTSLVGRFDDFLLVEAVQDGWWYSAITPNGERVIAYHSDSDLPAANSARTPTGLFQLLLETKHVQTLVDSSRWLRTTKVHGCSAQSRTLNPLAGDDWASVGDAALSFDPISSQGLTNALYSGLLLGRALQQPRAVGGLLLYRSRMEQVATRYAQNKEAHYGLDLRFAEQTFWARRQRGRPDYRR